MRTLVLIVLWLLTLHATAFAQGEQSMLVGTSDTLPANCSVGAMFYKTGTSAGFYNCSVTDTWTVVSFGSAGAWTQLSQIVTSGSQSTVDFTSISGSYNTLVLKYTSQDTTSGTSASVIRVRLNNDTTAANYSNAQRIGAQNGAAFASTNTSTSGGMFIGAQPNAGNTGDAATGEVWIVQYSGTTWNKRIDSWNGSDDVGAGLFIVTSSGRWKSSAAVTRLTVTTDGTAFSNGSIFTLYGVN
jgi:hypothetical protein